jgi:DNA-binding NtrC family response regulator
MGISILFVDDDKALLQGIGRIIKLEKRDVDFSLTSGAQEAKEMLKKASFDAVVADYRMPDEDGITFLEYVRTVYPGIKRILLTGQSEAEVYNHAVTVADKYIAKPCDTMEIIQAVENLVGNND